MALVITVNGKQHTVKSSPDTPLLYVLRNELLLQGPHFGCGLSQCGACAVLLNNQQIRSCVTPVAGVVGQKVVTLEGLPALHAQQHGKGASATTLHPLQQAWIDEQAPQCGYCQNGMIIQAADLLMKTAHPTDAQIRQAMNGHLCRCGTYSAIIRAIKRAAATTA
ncbi:MAG TPA: (2Fe-2S)-binding protein [Chloroflexota bacterium]|jgi:aerobic-type carbon monoxide dehydrogenase small subunit (CoxS/CutS family)|nr:(2Fe-2S)-binding protein [Chloroflexota bacterium]